ncbi:MAG: cytochrome c [Gemmatimonadaceae bacterium]|nr:cytochrome c [Gemmatimonadaceae bacterium]MCW5826568.1 cytochrome c [Gemmatimonadaceae bacterium]
MRARTLGMVLGGAGLLAAVTAAAPALRGGWAILTVHELPESVVVGEATTLTFTLRQHGEELMTGRAPVLQLRSGGLLGQRQRVEAERTREPGVYRATFTPGSAEPLHVRVDTDYHGWTVDLLPMTVHAAGTRVTRASSAAPNSLGRGRALFVAKGCVGCHTKADDAALRDYPKMRVGPDLTGRSFPAEFLVQKMTDTDALRPTQPRFGSRQAVMPQLEVTAGEAREIAAYLNARSVASRD